MVTDGYDSKTPEFSKPTAGNELSPNEAGPTLGDLNHPFVKALRPLGSLWLTIVLLGLCIFLVLAGSLVQRDLDIWKVIDRYFASFVAWIDLDSFRAVFFPFLPRLGSVIIPFPGGATLGILLAVNLVAAQAFRFSIRARGARLLAGVLVIAIGALLTYLVIAGGSNKDGLQDIDPLRYDRLWNLFLVALGLLWGVGIFGIVRVGPRRQLEFWSLIAFCAALGVFLAWLLTLGKAGRLNDSSMRILWQLSEATFAGLVLLGGCVLVFRRRAGLVLTHAGIGLLIFSELLVRLTAVEAEMPIVEGETAHYVRYDRAVELVVIDPSDPETDDVVAVPEHRLKDDEIITHENLPFDVEVVEFHPNADIQPARRGRKNLATAGLGLQWVSKSIDENPKYRHNVGAVYLKLTRKDNSKDIGTYLVSHALTSNGEFEVVPLEAKDYYVGLRFKRIYKPYSITLLDVRKDDYVGTDTARNFSSDVRVVDEGRQVDRVVKIWMNNPLRFAGETFYQLNYGVDAKTRKETTTLQVVANTNWMIPYVACMIVSIGMLYHFAILLLRFLAKRAENVSGASEAEGAKRGIGLRLALDYVIPGAVVLMAAVWLLGKTSPPEVPAEDFQLQRFGQLPVVYEGRVKPLDTLARNSLRIVSDRDVFEDEDRNRQPAVRWLLDLVADPKSAERHRVFRIQSLELLDTFGLKPRKGYRYSFAELKPKRKAFDAQVQKAGAIDREDRDRYQGRVMKLFERIHRAELLEAAFKRPPLPPVGELSGPDREKARQQAQEFMQAFGAIRQWQVQIEPPLAVPMTIKAADAGSEGSPTEGDDVKTETEWVSFAMAWSVNRFREVLGQPPGEAGRLFTNLLDAYGEGDTLAFNDNLAAYELLLAENPPDLYEAEKNRFEARFNVAKPFLYTAIPYAFAFVLAAFSWLGWSRPLNRTAFWLIVFTFAVHTAALIARVYISGRPPVTNPYSSLIFVGWGCVVLGLVVEIVFRTGVGNAIGGLTGSLSLLAANLLITGVQSAKGDTIAVQQAVLDTTFWLATHVTSSAFGYSAVFIAGALGIVYILGGIFTPRLDGRLRDDIARMIFGTLCFAIFFSFVGTVLGGLWADDAWGRFWGWDPKENGALMIVLWVAVVLHARCAKIVGNRGLAMMAIWGNIFTAWAWFHVNDLNIGLHTYGATEGVQAVLRIFYASQLAIFAVGFVPEKDWWSIKAGRQDDPDDNTAAVVGADQA